MGRSVLPTVFILILVVIILVVVIIFTVRGYPTCPTIPECPKPTCPTIPPCPAAPACNCPTPLGGIGANCLVDSACVTGLSCESGQCVCKQLDAPVIVATISGPGAGFVLNWTPVPNAVSYSLAIFGPGLKFLFQNYTGTSYDTGPISAGVYNVSAWTLSENCGDGVPVLTTVVAI